MAMDGFHEDGQPDGWDLTLGTVRGYRWWRALLTFKKHTGFPAVARTSLVNRIPPPPPDPSPAEWTEWEAGPMAFLYAHPERYGPDWFSPWEAEDQNSFVSGVATGMWRTASWGYKDGWFNAECGNAALSLNMNTTRHPALGDPYIYFSSPPAPPDPDCGCGFWAYWQPAALDEFDLNVMICHLSDSSITLSVPVAGMIEGSGRVILGSRGFRAQKARITNMVPVFSAPATYQDLRPRLAPIMYRDFADFIVGGSFPTPGSPVRICGPNAADGLTFLGHEVQMHPAQLRLYVNRAISQSLPVKEITFHDSVQELLEATSPDENYGNGR